MYCHLPFMLLPHHNICLGTSLFMNRSWVFIGVFHISFHFFFTKVYVSCCSQSWSTVAVFMHDIIMQLFDVNPSLCPLVNEFECKNWWSVVKIWCFKMQQSLCMHVHVNKLYTQLTATSTFYSLLWCDYMCCKVSCMHGMYTLTVINIGAKTCKVCRARYFHTLQGFPEVRKLLQETCKIFVLQCK